MKDLELLSKMDELKIIHTGYLLGYLNAKTIHDWADNQLLLDKKDYPHDLLIDISCANDKQLLSFIFRNNTQYNQNILPLYLSLYRILGEKKKLSYNSLIIEVLSSFNVSNNAFQDNSWTEEDEKYDFFFTRLSDYQALIKDGFTGNMNMPLELISFLSHYHEDISIFGNLNFIVKGFEIKALLL